MKKLWMLLAGVALVMSVACSDDAAEEIVPVPEDGLTTLTEIKATLPNTRTVLEDQEYAPGITVKTYWSEGDCISVWSDTQLTPVLFRADIDESDPTRATFRVVNESESVQGKEFFALYNGVNDVASKTISLSSSQGGNGSSFIDNGVAPMAAHTIGTAPEFAEAFEFENLCGIMALSFTVPDADGITLSKLALIGGNPLAGNATATYTGGKWTLTRWNGESNSLTRNCVIKMAKNQTYTVYVVVPAGTYEYLSVDAYITSDPTKPILKRLRQGSDKAFTINAGTITRVANFQMKTVAPHAYEVGNVYPYDATGDAVQGIVFEVADDGMSGKIVALKDCETGGTKVDYEGFYFYNYKWGTFESLTTINNGLSNTNAMIAAGTNAAIIDALNTMPTTNGIRWYLPSESEFQTMSGLVGSFDAAAPLSGDNYWTSTLLKVRLNIIALTYYSYDPDALAYVKKTVSATSITSKLPDGASVRAIAQFESK